MTTSPRSQKPSRTGLSRSLRGLLLIAIGGAAFYGFQLADRAVVEGLEKPEIAGATPTIEVPSTPAASGPGNTMMRRAALALDQRQSLSGAFEQRGRIDGSPVELSGRYLQVGSGRDRRFRLDLAGAVGKRPTWMLRVSNGRFLWTAIEWSQAQEEERQRAVTRVDLRRVRRSLPTASDWARHGGLPSLIEGLDQAFSFGQERRMQIGPEHVLAFVGRWREGPGAGDDRAPHHVVVALAESNLLPRLIEYRDARDPLSAAGLNDNERLQPSRRPMLKIELTEYAAAPPLPPTAFEFSPTDDSWTDQTARELRVARAGQ